MNLSLFHILFVFSHIKPFPNMRLQSKWFISFSILLHLMESSVVIALDFMPSGS